MRGLQALLVPLLVLLPAAGAPAAERARPAKPAAAKPARAAPPAVSRPAPRTSKPSSSQPRPPVPRPAPVAEPPASDPTRIAAPLRTPPPPCPATLSAIGDGLHMCRCASHQVATGAVFGDVLYAGGSATCRAGLHAGLVGLRGGDLLIRVLPLAGETPGAARHRIASQPGAFEGRAYRLLAATAGQVDWARRLAMALSIPNPALPRVSARAEEVAPLPLPQAADLNDLLLRAPGAAEAPGLDHLAPPALMPALWRTPVRAPDAPPPPEGAGPRPLPLVGAPLPPPLQFGPIAGPATVIGITRLLVSGVPVDLAWLEPGEGGEARQLGQFLDRRGGTAHCAPAPAGAPGLRCSSADGIDLGEFALYNGLARTTLEAPDAYRYAERAAREGRRGVWKAEAR